MKEQMMESAILVVDDEPAILDVVQAMLTGEGYRIQARLNGVCLHSLESDLLDLILLDVLLHGEDGRELCAQLKGREQTRHIPVILFSAHIAAKGAPEGCKADDFLTKPFRRRICSKSSPSGSIRDTMADRLSCFITHRLAWRSRVEDLGSPFN
jgi:CheY-like chemotaxis protein